MGKKDELAGDKSRALAVFLGDLNSPSEFGDGKLESSWFDKSLFFFMTRGGTFF